MKEARDYFFDIASFTFVMKEARILAAALRYDISDDRDFIDFDVYMFSANAHATLCRQPYDKPHISCLRRTTGVI